MRSPSPLETNERKLDQRGCAKSISTTLDTSSISGPFCILYGWSQSRVRAVLFFLDTNWTQRFKVPLSAVGPVQSELNIPTTSEVGGNSLLSATDCRSG